MLELIRVCPLQIKDIPSMCGRYEYVFIEGKVNVKVFSGHKDEKNPQPFPVDHILGVVLWGMDFPKFNSLHYVILADRCLYDISDWSSKELLELMVCRKYASQSTNIVGLRTFLEL